MIKYVKELFLSKYLGGLVRHLMSALAGILLAIGIDPTVVEQFTNSGTTILIAVILYVLANGSSVVEKIVRK